MLDDWSYKYRLGNQKFLGIQFSQKGHLQRFRDVIFEDGCSGIENVCLSFLFCRFIIFVLCQSCGIFTLILYICNCVDLENTSVEP